MIPPLLVFMRSFGWKNLGFIHPDEDFFNDYERGVLEVFGGTANYNVRVERFQQTDAAARSSAVDRLKSNGNNIILVGVYSSVAHTTHAATLDYLV